MNLLNISKSMILFMFLTACQSVPARAPDVGLVLAGDGLRPPNSDLRIDFGRAEPGVIAAVSKLMAQDFTNRNSVAGCGDLVRWSDDIELTFITGNFRGWAAKPERFFNANGVFQSRPDGWVFAGKTC